MPTSAIPDTLTEALTGRYTIERELGRGGMATVYLAQDLRHKRRVALKVLDPELGVVVGGERFRREIEMAAELQHPHVLPVFDSGEAGTGGLWYTMPYVEGESLRERIRREGRLPIPEALRLAREIAEALDYAHSHGVIHRDIKPGNILLSQGHALVADFGIARQAARLATAVAEGSVETLLAEAGLTDMSAVDSLTGATLTSTGMSLGTPAYMSPEQALGARDLDGRSDQYAVGCVLYEMLTGAPPYTGSSARAVIGQHVTAPVANVRAVRPEVPAAVGTVLAKALAKTPEARFATAAELAAALEHAAPTSLKSALAPYLSRRRLLIGSLGFLAVAALGLAGVLRYQGSAPSLDEHLVAVVPFEVMVPRLAVWREAMVDYLSRGLDGAGSLHTVPPTTISRRWQGAADRATAAEFGRRTGAGLVVYGRLLPIGQDSVRLVASVVDARRGAVIAEARSAELAEHVDRAGDTVLVDILLQIASTQRPLGTRSLPAIKAFLRGEQHFRERSLDSAVASFRQAVELDTTFSLALRRLVSTYQWKGDPDVELGRRLSLQAGRFNHGLSARDSLLVAADSIAAATDDTLLSSIARVSLRRRRSRTLWTATQTYPNDPEVWYQVGEARVHYGSEIGATMARAMEAFDRSISLDSSFAVAYEHPISYTLYRGDCERALAYLRKAASIHLPGVTDAGLAALVLERMLRGAAGWRVGIKPMLDTLPGPALKELAFKVRNCPDSGETSIWLQQQLAERPPGRGAPRDPAEAQVELAGALMTRGHLAQSYRVLRTQPIVGLSRFIFSQLAFLGAVTRDTADAVFRRWLSAPDLGSMARAVQWWAAQRDTSSIKAMISRAKAKARVANREFRDNDSEGGRIAQVYLALARADTAEVWRRLAHVGGWQDENVLRSRLYAAQGKDSAAADVIEWEGWEGARNVLQRLLQAQIMERLDQPDEALRSYQFVLEMWRHADPELATYVAQARAGVQRLSGTTVQ